MTASTINRFIQLFVDAFNALQAQVPMQEIEHLAMLVHSAMESRKRFYHASWHVFFMCEGMQPKQVLAALFHDVVYYGLDGGFSQQLSGFLTPLVHNEHGTLILKEIDERDISIKMCADIFGIKPGQVLPVGGMNEFLSAVVAVRVLQPYLSLSDLLAVVACIEATVPFRPAETSVALLEQRVRTQSFALLGEMSAEAIELYVTEVVHDAVKIANRDVQGFAESNPCTFLSETWLLIEESNVPLWDVGICTLLDYRNALFRMANFLENLQTNVIFRRFNNIPDDVDYVRLTEAARHNIDFACDFLRAKLTSIAIIEALALVTGGNAPVSMFLGDIATADDHSDHIEDFLPKPITVKDIDKELLLTLEKGRSQKSCNDLTESPLTAFVYRFLGSKGILQTAQLAKRMFAGELQAIEFIKALNPEMVCTIANACAQIAISRREPLLKLQADLAQGIR